MTVHARFYPDELKAEAVRLVIEHRLTAGEAAMKLGVRSENVLVWVRRFRASKTQGNEVDQLRELVRSIANERDALLRITSQLIQKVG